MRWEGKGMKVVNAYTVRPADIRPGDVMMFVIKAMVTGSGEYRLYRCAYDGGAVPQGDRIRDEKAVCGALFPSLAAVADPAL